MWGWFCAPHGLCAAQETEIMELFPLIYVKAPLMHRVQRMEVFLQGGCCTRRLQSNPDWGYAEEVGAGWAPCRSMLRLPAQATLQISLVR